MVSSDPWHALTLRSAQAFVPSQAGLAAIGLGPDESRALLVLVVVQGGDITGLLYLALI